MRTIRFVALTGTLLARAACAQNPSPVAVRNAPTPSVMIAPAVVDDYGVGAVPFVLLGTLAGAGAVTLYWIHTAKANNSGDDGFIVPPIVFVSVGLGGLTGGVLGYTLYKATR